MYKLVKRILDKSKATGEDIFVARDMCVAEDRENADKLYEAGELIHTHYNAVTKLRREGDEASIEKLCELVENGDVAEVRAFKEEIEKR